MGVKRPNECAMRGAVHRPRHGPLSAANIEIETDQRHYVARHLMRKIKSWDSRPALEGHQRGSVWRDTRIGRRHGGRPLARTNVRRAETFRFTTACGAH